MYQALRNYVACLDAGLAFAFVLLLLSISRRGSTLLIRIARPRPAAAIFDFSLNRSFLCLSMKTADVENQEDDNNAYRSCYRGYLQAEGHFRRRSEIQHN